MDIQELIENIKIGIGTQCEDPGCSKMASEYEGKCHDLLCRLEAVNGAINDGRIADAAMLSDAEPLLFAACRQVMFDGVENWKAICKERGWPEAKAILLSEVDRLEAAIKEFQSPSFLLQEYRNAARSKDLKRCIWLLRKLKELNPGNASHDRDLKEFEIRRIAELRHQFKSSCSKGDEGAIRQAASEILSVGWTSDVPMDLKNAALAEVSRLDRERALGDARHVLDQLATLYSAMDVVPAIPLMASLDALLASSGVDLPPALKRQYEEVRDWCRSEEQRQADHRDFERKMEKLGQAVEAGDGAGAESALNELARHNRALPDVLKERAELLVESWNLDRDRKRQRMNIAIVAGLVILGLAGLLVWQRIATRQKVVMTARAMEEAIQRMDLAALGAQISRLKSEDPGVLSHPDIGKILSRTNDVVRKIEQNASRMASLAQRVKDGMEASPPPEDMDAMIKEAESLARSREELDQINELSQQWARIQSERRRSVQDAWDTWVEKMEHDLKVLEERSSAGDKNAITQSIRDCQARFAECPALPDPAYTNIFSGYQLRLEKVENHDANIRQQWALIENAQTLPEYLDALSTFAIAFPDDPRTPAIRDQLKKRKIYEALISSPITAPTDHEFWGKMSERAEQSKVDLSKWPEIRDAVTQWESDDRMINMFTYVENNRITYIQGMPKAAENNLYLEVMYFTPQAGQRDLQPQFNVTTQFSQSRRHGIKPMSHCVFLDSLIVQVKMAKPEDGYELLLAKTDAWLGDKTIPAILRAQMGSELLKFIQSLSSSAELTLEPIRADLESMMDSPNWMCSGHPQYSSYERKAEEANSRAQKAVVSLHRSKMWKDVDMAARARHGEWYTTAKMDRSPTWNNPKRAQDRSKELWVLREDRGRYRIFIWTDADSKEIKTPLEPGEPIFVPADRSSTRDTLMALRGRGINIQTKDIVQDPAWPANYKD